MSGATLIAIAIAAFVVLVSTQVFGDWPIAGLVGGGDRPAVSSAQEVSATNGGGAATPGTVAGKGAAAGGKAGATRGGKGSGGSGEAGLAGSRGGGESGSNGGGDNGGGNPGGGGNEAGGGGAPSGSGGSGGGAASSGGGSTSGGGGTGGGGTTTTPSPSGQVTGTVNETVHTVDENVTGGTLEATGVTGVTEEVVEGVAGPESVVGGTVDEVGKTVEGLLGK
ncbi:MAG TPA: hypothetical protein VFP21_10375 [Solirubrobacterales bacterium]|nr:hypothetical protein [Solirubrobacterales bacterium]